MKRDILLIVDDAEVNRILLGRMFERLFRVETVSGGIEALKFIMEKHDEIALVLLDLLMPEMDGYEVLIKMDRLGYLEEIPVVLSSTADSERTVQKGMELGAMDFIAKPYQPGIVITRVNNCIELFNRRRESADIETCKKKNRRYQMLLDMSSDLVFDYNLKNDTIHFSEKFAKIFGNSDELAHARREIWFMKLIDEQTTDVMKHHIASLTPEAPEFDMEIHIRNKSGRMVWYRIYLKALWESENMLQYTSIIGKLVDIDQLKSESSHWKDQAGRDALTRVNNRMAAQEMIYSSIHEYPDETCAFIFLDVDDFKHVNDNYGHRTGDEVLMYISSQLQRVFRKTDIIWRIGGDEFAVFARNIPDRETIKKKLDELCEIYSSGYEKREISCEVSGSIGVAFYPEDGQDYDTLMSKADKALYYAKAAGKNRYSFYDKTKM